MFNIPTTDKALRSRVSSYKSALKREKRDRGCINDGSGKRYILFYLYFILDDLKRSDDYFKWYHDEFPDDVGEPIQKLCWAITLYRMGEEGAATYRLADLMISNLYIIPRLLGRTVQEYPIWQASSDGALDYFDDIPAQVLAGIRSSEMAWMAGAYDSSQLCRIRERYLGIYGELKDTRGFEARSRLIDEAETLLDPLMGQA